MRNSLTYPLLLPWFLLFSATLGCGSSAEKDANVRRAAYAIYDEAANAFQAKQYEAAEATFTAAIDAGGLNFDFLCDAHIKRAVCRAAAKRFDEALTELKEVEDHGGDLAKIESARSYVLRKRGNEAGARAALARARRLDPSVEVFRD